MTEFLIDPNSFEDQEVVPDSQLVIPSRGLFWDDERWKDATITQEEMAANGFVRALELRRSRSPQGFDTVRAVEAGTQKTASVLERTLVNERSDVDAWWTYPMVEGVPMQPLSLARDRPGMLIASVDREQRVVLSPARPDPQRERSVYIHKGHRPDSMSFYMETPGEAEPQEVTTLDINLGHILGSKVTIAVRDACSGEQDRPTWGIAIEYDTKGPVSAGVYDSEATREKLDYPNLDLRNARPWHWPSSPTKGDWVRVSTDSIKRIAIEQFGLPSQPFELVAAAQEAYMNMPNMDFHPLQAVGGRPV